MQSRNRMFDDLARVTNSAASVMSGFREEAESAVRQRLERLLADMDLVPREEFDAMKAVAVAAREAQETLTDHVAALEKRLAALEAAQKAQKTPKAPKQAAAKPAGGAAPKGDG